MRRLKKLKRPLWRVLVAAPLLLSSGAEPVQPDEAAESCSLVPLEGPTLDLVDTAAHETLTPKLERIVTDLVRDPCTPAHRGMLVMACRLKNTADPLAAFTTRLLGDLGEADSTAPRGEAMARVWELVPDEARRWTLTAFVAGLQCTVAPGAATCAEEETNAALRRYEQARDAFARRALAAAGMPPFPVDADDDDDDDDAAKNAASSSEAAAAEQKSGGDVADGTPPSTPTKTPEEEVRGAMARYAKRLGLDGAPAAWLASQFAPAPPSNLTNQTTIQEPPWFAGVATRCRRRARLEVPDAQTGDGVSPDTDLADLDAAVRLAAFAWHYKTCHRDAVLHAFEHKDDDPAASSGSAGDPDLDGGGGGGGASSDGGAAAAADRAEL